MKDTVEKILAVYEHPDRDEDTRLDRHQIEREMTVRYFEKVLPPSGKILEIGAATGPYTRWLAKRGYQVTAIDLSKLMINRCEKKLAELGLDTNVTCLAGDARDLSFLEETDFDAVLVMGPLYHLAERKNRDLVLEQSLARLKPGGIYLSTHISRLGVFGPLLKNHPGWIAYDDEVRHHLEHGCNPEHLPVGRFHLYAMTTDEVIPFHEAIGLETILLAGLEPVISGDDEMYNCLEGDLRQQWLDLLFEISQDRSIMGSSRHLLYVGRRPQ